MSYLLSIAVFIFGAIVGSFLNVIILRGSVGGGKRKRSICLSCGKVLYWRDLFPVISFLILGGRCRHCRCKISWQYPLVEIAAGLLFLFSFWQAGKAEFFNYAIWDGLSLAAMMSVLLVIFVHDLRHKIIIDQAAVALGAIAILRIFVFYWGGFDNLFFWLDLAAGPISALPFFLLWFVSRGKWMGLGDAKLMLGLGWFVGWELWLSSTILAFWLGALVIILASLFGYVAKVLRFVNLAKVLPIFKMKTEVPFGPFLIISAFLSYFFNLNIFSVFVAVLM